MITRTREEAVRRWVAALRSGEYKQAHEQLRTTNGFCCLGVLCDLVAKDGGPQWGNGWFMGDNALLPDVVAEFLSPGYAERLNENKRHVFNQLAWMNDRGSSFEQLAAKIERELL